MRSLTICLLIGMANISHAEMFSMDIAAHYKMGDNESVATARKLCVADAKRQAADYSESFVESQLTVQTTEDNDGQEVSRASKESRTISAQLVSAKLLEERLETMNNRMVFSCVVQTKFDPDQINNKLQGIMDAQRLQKQIDAQNAQIAELKKQVAKPVVQPQTPVVATALVTYTPPVTYAQPVTYNPPVTYVQPVTYYTPPQPVRYYTQPQVIYTQPQTVYYNQPIYQRGRASPLSRVMSFLQ